METTITYSKAYTEQRKVAVPTQRTEFFTVFIVEDNFASRMLLERYLNKLPNCPPDKRPNLDIHTFESGEECIASPLKPDILILDYYLDEANKDALDGLSVLRKMKKRNPNLKTIIISGQQNVMITAELYNEGASDYVAKEHSCTVRVEQSLLRLISEIRWERKKRRRNLILAALLFIAGIACGMLINF